MADELDSYIGREFASIEGADEITEASVRQLLEALDWDWPGARDTIVGTRHGHTIVPLSTYLSYALPAYRSRGEHLPPTILPRLPYHRVPMPFPYRMATSVEVAPGPVDLMVGDRISSTWSVAEVHRTTTRLGEGAFVTYEAVFRNQHGGVVAVERATLLGFQPPKVDPADVVSSPARAPRLTVGMQEWDPVAPLAGTALRPVRIDLTLLRLAMIHAANRDFAPIHNDPAAAAGIGARGVVINSIALVSLVERLLVDNAGPGARVRMLGPLHLRKPTAAGQVLTVAGAVTAVTPEEDGYELSVDIEFSGERDGVTATAEGRVFVPPRR